MKVGKIGLRFELNKELKYFELHYKQSDGFSVKGLPFDFCTMMHVISYGYDTEKELIEYLQKAVKEYGELRKTERKVILFKINSSPNLRMNKIGNGSYEGPLSGVSSKIKDVCFGALECTIGFEYKVCKEVYNREKIYHVIFDDGTLGHSIRESKDWEVIDHTEKRELFFKSIYVSMGELVKRMSDFFGEDNEKLLLKIDNSPNQKLLS